MITEHELSEAEARMNTARADGLHAVGACYDRRVARVVVTLASGIELALPPRLVQGLEHAKPDDLAEIEITPTGLGLHFPKLDADLYIPALLSGLLGTKSWSAAEMGKVGGSARTTAKKAAARENGKRGGRPRKVA